MLTASTVSCSDYLDTEPITDRAVPLSDTPYTKASEAEDLMTALYSDFGNEQRFCGSSKGRTLR